MRHELLQTFTLTLLQASRAWRRAADEVVTAYGLTEATALPLLLIGRRGRGSCQDGPPHGNAAPGALRQGVLAEALGIEGPSLVRVLDQLGEAGLVRRLEDPTDRRAKVLRLTPRGEAVSAAIEARFAALRAATFADLGDEDLRAALRVLGAVQTVPAGAGPDASALPAEEPDPRQGATRIGRRP